MTPKIQTISKQDKKVVFTVLENNLINELEQVLWGFVLNPNEDKSDFIMAWFKLAVYRLRKV